MNVAECAEAGCRDRGCKQRIPGKGWVNEQEGENRFAVTDRVSQAIWREMMTVAAMGKEEKERRRALRVKVRHSTVLLVGHACSPLLLLLLFCCRWDLSRGWVKIHVVYV